MSDPLELLLSSEVVDERGVLELVDEYQMLSFYLQGPFECRTPIHSPFREDAKKSFSLFSATNPGVCEFLWKDSGNGKVGNVFHLVQALYSLSSRQEVFKQIDRDFHLDLFPGNIPLNGPVPCQCHEKPIPKAPAQIRVRSQEFTKEGLAYWKAYGITLPLLTQYRVSQVSHFWTQATQLEPFTPRGLAFAYHIGNRYKLYQPHSQDIKFLNNLDSYMVEGWLQLTPGPGPLCIITKSTKDTLVLRSLGYESVSPRSESTAILPNQLRLLEERYKRLVILFDNDFTKEVNVGQELAKHYPYESIYIPTSFQAKDISDFRKERGEEKTRELLHHLLHSCQ